VTAALTLLVAGSRVGPSVLHPAVVLFTAFIGVMVAIAATERGLMLSALGYTWAAVYVAFFLSPSAARIYAAYMTVALGSACCRREHRPIRRCGRPSRR
jgi:hypothetical protein